MSPSRLLSLVGLVSLCSAGSVGCGFDRRPAPADQGVYGYANGCYVIEGFDGDEEPTFLVPSGGGSAFAFAETSEAGAARFFLRPSDLGTYLLYDSERRYVAAQGSDAAGFSLGRVEKLESTLTQLDDTFRSPAEWQLEPSPRDLHRYQLRHHATQEYLTLHGLSTDPGEAAIITLFPGQGCAEPPELPLDATGAVTAHPGKGGELYGIAEIHSHMMTNFGFGGGSTFHGAPFHRLGVEHALPDCEPWHGFEGRRDVVGFFFDGETSNVDTAALLPIMLTGQTSSFVHHTAGYPDFTDWPNTWKRATHQTMYYRWVERAYLGGLRLMVQLATGNSVLCDLVTGIRSQTPLISCNDMVSVDRQILETRNLERYIDAQSGGRGKGWLRVVDSPEAAREVVAQGKLAVVLGIEISNLFDCFLTPPAGFEACSEQMLKDKLDHYRELGVRVIFPVHKFDNGLGAGDGSNGVIELGNFINTGHYTSDVPDCPGPDAAFDGGGVTFGGLNQPRDDYDAPPPVDMSGFAASPVSTLLPFLEPIQAPPLEGNYCRNHGLTPLGETFIQEMMKRGMLVDIAHLPQRSLARAYELLEAASYPVLKTHGGTNGGRVYANGGMASTGLGRFGGSTPGAMGQGLAFAMSELEAAGAFPAEALAFDLNGFAHGPRPRFGPDSPCSEPQANPVTYPFTSYDGQITFEQPTLGNRVVDFNTEGMIHIGLLPELIEDARRDGVTDAELAPLFRSAEAFVRMWERAEERGAALSP